MKKRISTKNALALSAMLLVFWVLLATNATGAWFSDTTQTAKNTFIIVARGIDVMGELMLEDFDEGKIYF